MYDIVISVNIYKSIKTLWLQLETIKDNVKPPYCIIYNCNAYMFKELLSIKLPDNIFINPEIIEKRRDHGSIIHGIVSNMNFALQNFSFKYFLILSGRTILYRELQTKNLDSQCKKWYSKEEKIQSRIGAFDMQDWSWPKLNNTLLAKYYLQRGYILEGGAHEGLCLAYKVCNNILNFLKNNNDIENDLFNCSYNVEEFALQTIASNEHDEDNMEYGYIYIGNGVYETYDINNKNLYTRKIQFLQ